MSPVPQAPRPQLLMWFRPERVAARLALPDGYRLRTYQPGDEEGWARLLQANGQLGVWDLERVQGELRGPLLRQGQCFVVRGTQIVATAGVYQRQRWGAPALEIGWIACHPEHAGQGLGAAVTTAALAVALAQPIRPIYLLTDDHRVPALKTYLRLGFTPDLGDPSYPERWLAVLDRLGPAYASYRNLVAPTGGGIDASGASP